MLDRGPSNKKMWSFGARIDNKVCINFREIKYSFQAVKKMKDIFWLSKVPSISTLIYEYNVPMFLIEKDYRMNEYYAGFSFPLVS